MYDIDKDVENVAKAIEELAVICPSYTKEIARAALNASDAVKQLKELQGSWLLYKLHMIPETRNDFLRKCSSVFDITPPKQKD